MKLKTIQKRIAAIQQGLAELGPIHPGSISEQYNVCGNPDCRCKDPRRPRRHGPYYQLSYTCQGRHSTRFVRAEQLARLRQKLENYRRLRQLLAEWISLAVQEEQLERQRAKTDGD